MDIDSDMAVLINWVEGPFSKGIRAPLKEFGVALRQV